MSFKVYVAMGTRPSIIKMWPIVNALKKANIDCVVHHTGQHGTETMSDIFLRQLNFTPDYRHSVLTGISPPIRLENMIYYSADVMKREQPNLVLVCGDDDTCLAVALAALKYKISIGHIEAGLRSFDWRMPEEHNRVVVDHISNYLFAPTETSAENLSNEKVFGKVYIVGNSVIDAVLALDKKRVKVECPKKFILATAHRQENVDNPNVLKEFVKVFTQAPLPIVLPLHPRTEDKLKTFGLYEKLVSSSNVKVIKPLGYLEFLSLFKKCTIVLTDSGGIQEEATVYKKPTVVMRETSDRPESIEAGFAFLTGTNTENILGGIEKALCQKDLSNVSPYGDGHTSEKIVRIIEKEVKR